MVPRYLHPQSPIDLAHLFLGLTLGQSFGSTIAGVSGVAGATATTLSSPTAITFDTNNFM